MLTIVFKNKFVILIIIQLCTCYSTSGQNKTRVLENFNEEYNLSIVMEIPHISGNKFDSSVENFLHSIFEDEIVKYKNYFSSQDNVHNNLMVLVQYKIDSIYEYDNFQFIFYNVYQENIPMFNSSHWVESFVFEKDTGQPVSKKLCEFLGCGQKFIPLHKLINNKINEKSCQIVKDNEFEAKNFVPLNDNKILFYIWNNLVNDPNSCSMPETEKVIIDKDEIIHLIKN